MAAGRETFGMEVCDIEAFGRVKENEPLPY
jgi:hypothetical protein